MPKVQLDPQLLSHGPAPVEVSPKAATLNSPERAPASQRRLEADVLRRRSPARLFHLQEHQAL